MKRIQVPVLENFDNNKLIGMMEIDEAKIPKDADYGFAIAVRTTSPNVYELQSVSLVYDSLAPRDQRQPLSINIPVLENTRDPELQLLGCMLHLMADAVDRHSLNHTQLSRVSRYLYDKYGSAMLDPPAKA